MLLLLFPLQAFMWSFIENVRASRNCMCLLLMKLLSKIYKTMFVEAFAGKNLNMTLLSRDVWIKLMHRCQYCKLFSLVTNLP